MSADIAAAVDEAMAEALDALPWNLVLCPGCGAGVVVFDDLPREIESCLDHDHESTISVDSDGDRP